MSDTFLYDKSKSYVFLILACLAVYANSLSGDFIFDDTAQIVGNNALHSWQNVINAFTTDVWDFSRGTDLDMIPPPYYRPIFTIYLTVGYQLFGLWQQGWHLMNLAVHTGATILVYQLFLVLSGGSARLSFIAGLLFALIPVHVESISWISGVPDPLATLFYIPAIIFYIRWRQNSGRKYLVFSAVSFFLALLCKETPVVLPVILLIWELTLNRKENVSANLFSSLKGILIYIIPFVIYLIMRFSVLGKVSWKHPFITQTPTEYIYATIPYVIVTYIKNLLFPFNLSLIYGTRFVESFSDLIFWIPLLILSAIAAVLYYFRQETTPLMWMAIGLFIVPLLPVLNLQVFHYEYIVQDRYLYLPSIGFVLLISCLLEKLWTSDKKAYRQTATVAAVILCLAYAAGTFLHNRVWNSPVALWTRVTEIKPNSWTSHYNLALAYDQNKEHQKAFEELNEALKYESIHRKDYLIYNNRGLALQALGKREEAKKDYIKALEFNPDSIEPNINLGVLLFEEGDYAAAEKQFRKTLSLKPSNVPAKYNLARTLAKLGRHKEAIEHYEKLLQIEGEDADLMYNAAISYRANGEKQKAGALLNEAYRFAIDEKLKNQIAEEFEKLK